MAKPNCHACTPAQFLHRIHASPLLFLFWMSAVKYNPIPRLKRRLKFQMNDFAFHPVNNSKKHAALFAKSRMLIRSISFCKMARAFLSFTETPGAHIRRIILSKDFSPSSQDCFKKHSTKSANFFENRRTHPKSTRLISPSAVNK